MEKIKGLVMAIARWGRALLGRSDAQGELNALALSILRRGEGLCQATLKLMSLPMRPSESQVEDALLQATTALVKENISFAKRRLGLD